MRAVRFIGILCCALVFGLTLSHVLQAPGSRGLDVASWLAVQHTFYGGFAVAGGLVEIVGLLAASTDAFQLRSRGRAAAGPLIAAVCLLGTLLAYWFGNRPVNAKVAAWTTTTVPADWPAYRDQWEAAHAISAVLGAIALICLLAATIWPPINSRGRRRVERGAPAGKTMHGYGRSQTLE